MKAMEKHRHSMRAIALLLFWMCGASLAAQAQQSPLPSFEVTALDGSVTQSSDLSARKQWLLIYVQPNCKPCEDIFRVFQKKDGPHDLTQKVLVIVGGATVEEAQQLAKRISWLPSSAWYADESKRAAAALDVKGAPTVYGVRQGNIEWDLKGAPANERMLKSILETWCEG